MYSLGVVLLELCCPFSTEMERVIQIRNVKEEALSARPHAPNQSNHQATHVPDSLTKPNRIKHVVHFIAIYL